MLWRLLACVCLFALLPAAASAHAVGVDCTLRRGIVTVEVFYDDDTAAVKAKVQVVNEKGDVVASGITDKDGRWTFRKPAPGKYEVRADAGAGHRAKKTLNVPGSAPEDAAIGVLGELSMQVEPAERSNRSESTSIGDGPSRAELTRFPWEKTLVSLAIIGGMGGAFMIASQRRKNGNANGTL